MTEAQLIDGWLAILRQRGNSDRQIAYAAKVLAHAATSGTLSIRHQSSLVRAFVAWAMAPTRLNLKLQHAGNAIQDEFHEAFRRLSES